MKEGYLWEEDVERSLGKGREKIRERGTKIKLLGGARKGFKRHGRVGSTKER